MPRDHNASAVPARDEDRDLGTRSKRNLGGAWVLALGALLLLPSLARSQGSEVRLRPQAQRGGAAHAVLLESLAGGTRAAVYLGHGPRVEALDVVPGSTMRSSAQSPLLPGVVQGLARAETGLLVAAGRGGLQILEAQGPNLALLGGLDLPGETLDVLALEDKTVALLARGSEGIDLVDVSDAAAPEILGHLDLALGAQAMGLALKDNLVLVAAGVTGLHIIDVSEPAAAVEIGRLDRAEGFPVQIEAVAVDRDAAFACDGPRILVVGLDDPARPSLRTTLELEGRTCRALALARGQLIALSIDQLDASARLHRFDLGGMRPARSAEVDLGKTGVPAGIFETPRPRMGLATTGDGEPVFVAAGGLGPYQLPSWDETARPVGGIQGLAWPEAVAIEGQRAFVAAGAEGLQEIALGKGSLAEPRQHIGIPGYARDLAVRGDAVFVAAESGGIRHIEMPGPGPEGAPDGRAPRELDALDSLTAVTRVALAERHLYAADALAGLRIVRIGDAEAGNAGMMDIGGIDLGFDYPEGLHVDALHERLLVAYGSGVAVYDIADEAAPALLWRLDTPGFARDVSRIGDDLLVADDQAGLSIYYDALERDVAPDRVVTVDTPGSAQAVSAWAPASGGAPPAKTPADGGLEARLAYVADGEGGVIAVNLDSGGSGPSVEAGFDLPREAVGIAVEGGYLLVAARGSGLWRFQNRAFAPDPGPLYLPWLALDGRPGSTAR